MNLNLKEKLANRLKSSPEELDNIMELLHKYGIVPTIRNFDSQGLILFDGRGKSVRICFGNYREKMIHIQDPQTDIAVVYAGGVLCGWIEREKLQDIQDRMLVDV